MQSLVTKLAQITFTRFSRRHRILGIFRFPELDFEIATASDLQRVSNCVRKIAKDFAHFRGRFEIEFRLITHSLFVFNFRGGVDAKKNVVRSVIAAPEEVDVVRRDQTESEFAGEFWQVRIALLLLGHSVVVQLDEKISRSENIAIFRGQILRFLNVASLKGAVDLTRETAAQADQTVGMRRQQFLVDPWTIIKTIEMRRRDQLYQIAIASLVFPQQSEMKGGFA